MEFIWSVCVGVGLSAACGFRVFLPMLAIGVAVNAGHLHVNEGFAWVAGTPAMICFGAATLLEICAYYFPWVDNLLDTLATPTAVVAGVFASSSVIVDTSPLLSWSVAIIAGGGSAGVVQAGTAMTRQVSAFTTGGIGNPVVSSVELVGAALFSLLAVLLPLLAVVGVAACFYLAWRLYRRIGRARQKQAPAGYN